MLLRHWHSESCRTGTSCLPRRASGTFKRPGVDAFLQAASQYYELVLYTDHLPTYADPILDRLDPRRLIQYRLYRDSTRYVPSVAGGAGSQHARDFLV